MSDLKFEPGSLGDTISTAMTILILAARGEHVVVASGGSAADAWLRENGLVDIHSGKPTDRGFVWLDMIIDTPLPIRAGWADPRFIEGSAASRTVRLVDEEQSRYDASPTAIRTYVAEVVKTMQMPIAIDDIPQGFTINPGVERTVVERAEDGTEIQRKISLPPGVDIRDAVVVKHRNGKVRGEDGNLPAGSVRWAHTGEMKRDAKLSDAENKKRHERVKGDDVIAYYIIANPDDKIRGTGLVP
jgi:hypothetical protein